MHHAIQSIAYLVFNSVSADDDNIKSHIYLESHHLLRTPPLNIHRILATLKDLPRVCMSAAPHFTHPYLFALSAPDVGAIYWNFHPGIAIIGSS